MTKNIVKEIAEQQTNEFKEALKQNTGKYGLDWSFETFSFGPTEQHSKDDIFVPNLNEQDYTDELKAFRLELNKHKLAKLESNDYLITENLDDWNGDIFSNDLLADFFINFDFYPFLNKEKTLQQIKDKNFMDLDNPDFFIFDKNHPESAPFVSVLWLGTIFSFIQGKWSNKISANLKIKLNEFMETYKDLYKRTTKFKEKKLLEVTTKIKEILAELKEDVAPMFKIFTDVANLSKYFTIEDYYNDVGNWRVSNNLSNKLVQLQDGTIIQDEFVKRLNAYEREFQVKELDDYSFFEKFVRQCKIAVDKVYDTFRSVMKYITLRLITTQRFKHHFNLMLQTTMHNFNKAQITYLQTNNLLEFAKNSVVYNEISRYFNFKNDTTERSFGILDSSDLEKIDNTDLNDLSNWIIPVYRSDNKTINYYETFNDSYKATERLISNIGVHMPYHFLARPGFLKLKYDLMCYEASKSRNVLEDEYRSYFRRKVATNLQISEIAFSSENSSYDFSYIANEFNESLLNSSNVYKNWMVLNNQNNNGSFNEDAWVFLQFKPWSEEEGKFCLNINNQTLNLALATQRDYMRLWKLLIIKNHLLYKGFWMAIDNENRLQDKYKYKEDNSYEEEIKNKFGLNGNSSNRFRR